MNNVRQVLIISHKNNQLVRHAENQLQTQLTQLGITYLSGHQLFSQLDAVPRSTVQTNYHHPHFWADLSRREVVRQPVSALDKIDLVVAIGGDGCLLMAAQWALQLAVPVIGINCGTLGFLGDISPNQINQLPRILTDGTVEERAVLLVNRRYLVVNELLLSGTCLGVLDILQVEVDGRPLCTYQSDGLVISTATGSTGHALSCGGPILEPTSRQMVLVPLASHKLSSRPLVITPQGDLLIKIMGKSPGNIGGYAVVDGKRISDQPIAQATISIAPVSLQMLHPPGYDFFAILRSKLDWEG